MNTALKSYQLSETIPAVLEENENYEKIENATAVKEFIVENEETEEKEVESVAKVNKDLIKDIYGIREP